MKKLPSLPQTLGTACRSDASFDGAAETEIKDMLELAGLPRSGQVTLYDGRTGEAFDRTVTVGYMHILKLHHLVDDKMHARSTGPYSLVTQPGRLVVRRNSAVSGSVRWRCGHWKPMEPHIRSKKCLPLNRMMFTGRTKVYENIVKGEHKIDAGMPESFNVLVKEIRSLAIDIDLDRY